MKKTISKILMIIVGALFIFTSCEETVFEEENTSSYDGSGDNYALFASQVDAVEFTKFNANNEAADYSGTLAVKLYGPAPTSDITLNVDVIEERSTALEDYHFTYNATVTIPAGELSGTLEYTLLNGYPYNEDGVPTDGIGMPLEEELNIYFELSGGDVEIYETGKSFDLKVKETDFCPFELTDFEGTFDVVEKSVYGGEYPTTYDIYYETAPEEQVNPEKPTFMIEGMWWTAFNVIWGETMVESAAVEATFDVTDITSPKIIIPGQFSASSTDGSAVYPYYVKTDDNGTVWVKNFSTYNSCEQQLEIYFLAVYGGPDGGLLDAQVAIVDVAKKTVEIKSQPLPLTAFSTVEDAKEKLNRERK